MALSEVKSPARTFDPARPAKTFAGNPVLPESLGELGRLHREAGHSLGLAQFLARSPWACLVLMLAGGLTLVWTGMRGGGTLRCDFAWAALMLLGVIAMTRNFIRGYARSLRRVPLEEAAADLRVLLLYAGAVWGAGAFLVMPRFPAPALVFSFAAAPSLALALTLGDAKAIAGFVTPASLITASAALFGAWALDGWVATAILLACAVLIGLPMLRRAMHRNVLPQSLLGSPNSLEPVALPPRARLKAPAV